MSEGALDKQLLEEDESPSKILQSNRELVQRCLNAVEDRAKKLQSQGVTKRNFVFGVANSLFVAWSFGALPGYFWIVYILEVFILLPIRWMKMVRASPKQHLYWLDFCWMANFLGVFLLIAQMANVMGPSTQRWVFSAAWGLGTGTLLCATTALGNALLFHDLDNVCAVLIHLFPSLVMYEMGWRGDRVEAAFPQTFKYHFFDDISRTEIYLNAATVYGVWFVLYLAWLLAIGLRCPGWGYDTIFHWAMRGPGGSAVVAKILGTPEAEHRAYVGRNDFPLSYVFVYMTLHAVSVLVSIPVSLLCHSNQWIHVTLCGVVALSTIYNASARYTYYMVHSYTAALKAELRIPRDRGASHYYSASEDNTSQAS